MNGNRRIAVIVAGAVAAALLVGCCAGAGGSLLWRSGTSGGAGDVASGGAGAGAGAGAGGGASGGAGATGPRHVTLAHYDAIKPNMQYGEVVRIIGFPGTEYTRNLLRDTGTRTQGFIWTNPDGSNLTCEFDNEHGTLFSKAQFGLK